MKQRWKRCSIGVVGAIGAYALVGGYLLPHWIQSQLPALVETELARHASIGSISFNPFTLHLTVRQLQFSESNGAPLFGAERLELELQWRSLVRRAWSVAELRIVAPTVQLLIAPDGRFNIAEFIAVLQRRPHHEHDTGMPRVIVERFALEQGKLSMDDQQAGYRDTFAPITFTLNHISTLRDAQGDFDVSAQAGRGGTLRWKGSSALNPLAGSGELVLDGVALPALSTYWQSTLRATLVRGRLSATLPYRYAYTDGQFAASLSGAQLTLNDLALGRGDGAPALARLQQFKLSDVGLDLGQRTLVVGSVHASGGALALHRAADGALDVAGLLVAPAAAPVAQSAPAPDATWKIQLKQVVCDDLALSAVDDSVSPSLSLNAQQLALRLQLQAETAAAGPQLQIADARFSAKQLVVRRGALTPFTLERLGVTGGSVDLAAHRFSLDRLVFEGGQLDLSRDRQGRFRLLDALPPAAPSAPAASATELAAPWTARINSVEFQQFGARYDDERSALKANLQQFNLKLADVSNDLQAPLTFDGRVSLREGGQLSAQGRVVPATGALDAKLKLSRLTLATMQPLLSDYVRLKFGGGSLSGQGRLHTGSGTKASPALRYDGTLEVADLVLNEEDNDRFAHWKMLKANQLTFSLSPNLLDVAELRLIEPDAALIIENDRSFNAQRLLVQQPAAAPVAPSAAAVVAVPAAPPFPATVRRLRLENARLAFTDLSLRPQFAAKIYELGGVMTGLSSQRDARSQIELDGRVDDYGLARIRGQLNLLAPSEHSDVNLLFKNVDLVAASPYSVKFAGYSIAQGKISLDLQYQVHQGQLSGNNQLVLDQLTLGERVDSPDALKLPLDLALAILKDGDGRINFGVPVSGNMNDPQFNYGAVVWQALGNLMSKAVTSPFRALGNLFGVSGEHLEAIEFDPGSAQLLPPEREKLAQLAQILARKPQLRLAVPAQYSESVDGAALRAQTLQRLVLARAGSPLEAAEQPGPLDLGQSQVRAAVRDLYVQRLGAAALAQQKQAAENAAAQVAGASGTGTQARLAVLQRLTQLVQGEPQVADLNAFYAGLVSQLEQHQTLAPDVLPQLGAQRAAALLAALKQVGVGDGALQAAAPEAVSAAAGAGQPIAVKLGLAVQ